MKNMIIYVVPKHYQLLELRLIAAVEIMDRLSIIRFIVKKLNSRLRVS
jgi:hypothetical protein